MVKSKIFSLSFLFICIYDAETRQVREPGLLLVSKGVEKFQENRLKYDKLVEKATQNTPDVDSQVDRFLAVKLATTKANPKTKAEIREELEDEIKREIEEEVREKAKEQLREEIKRDSKEKTEEEINEIEDEMAREVAKEAKDEKAREEADLRDEDLSNVAEAMLELERKWHAFLITISAIIVLIILAVAVYFVFRRWSAADDAEGSSESDQPDEHRLAIPLDSEPLGGRTLSEIAKMKSNLLFLLVPLGAVGFYWNWYISVVVSLNLMAIVPGAYLLTIATEEIAIDYGDHVAAFVNVWIGNLPLLVLLVVAVMPNYQLVHVGAHPYAVHKELEFLFGSLTGTALSMSALVLGISYMVGGLLVPSRSSKPWYIMNCAFDRRSAVTQGQTLLASSLFKVFPVVFGMLQHVSEDHLRLLYRAITLFYMLYYAAFTAYQFQVLRQLSGSPVSTQRSARALNSPQRARALRQNFDESSDVLPLSHLALLLTTATVAIAIPTIILCNVTAEIQSGSGVNMQSIGMMVFGIIGCFAHYVAIKGALKGNLDLAIEICLGSAIQIVLLYFPVAVWCAYAFHKPEEILIRYDTFTMCFFAMSSFMVHSSLVHGQSNWLRGIALATVYIFGIVHMIFIPSTNEQPLHPPWSVSKQNMNKF